MKESKAFCTSLNKGQMNNLKGFIGEKISAMKRQEIKEYVLSRIGDSWKELNVTPFVEDWIGSPYDDKLLIKEKDTIYFNSTNPEQGVKDITNLFDTDKCFFLSKKAYEKLTESRKYLSDSASNIFPERGKTIADIEFVVYKISQKRMAITRTIDIKESNTNKNCVKIITKKIPIIEDVKPVLIELKAFQHSIKLTPPQQAALLESRKNKSFYYFILNVKFNINIEPEINIIEMQDRILKKINQKSL